MWTIYRYISPENKMYIGQTKNTPRQRAMDGYKQCRVFRNAIDKYGFENFTLDILEENIPTQEQANERERYWIAFYHTYVHDPQSRGYNLSRGGVDCPVNGVPVLSVEPQSRHIVEYASVYDASKKVGVSASLIYGCLCGTKKSAGGLYWCYKDKYNNSWEPPKYKRGINIIYQINPDTLQVIQSFKNLVEAANAVNGEPTHLRDCLLGIYSTFKEFYWCYATNWYKGWKPNNCSKHNRKIWCIETETLYNTAKEASEQTGICAQTILGCCLHRTNRKSAGGYHWIFLEEKERDNVKEVD